MRAPWDWDERPERNLTPAAGSDGCTVRVDGPLVVKSLSRIRHAIADQAADWQLADPIVETIQTVVSELAANIVAHAGGNGSLILTHRPGVLYCQAIDHGPGMPLPSLAGWRVPETGDPAAARGLWTVRMLSTRMHIDSSSLGTTVTTVLAWK